MCGPVVKNTLCEMSSKKGGVVLRAACDSFDSVFFGGVLSEQGCENIYCERVNSRILLQY